MKQWFDEDFLKHKFRYVLQCLLGTLAVMIVLLLLDSLAATAIIASLGATSFIAFTMPHAENCRPRYLLGGYSVGIVVGTFFKLLAMAPAIAGIPFILDKGDVLFGALAVGFAMFFMVILNFEHPPACGMALGILLNDFNWWVLAVVVVGVVSITLIKTLLKPFLRNLL